MLEKKSGKVALILSMEGAEGLEGDLRVLRNCYRLGLRCTETIWKILGGNYLRVFSEVF